MDAKTTSGRSVLMIDIGGTHVKLKCGSDTPSRRFDSGETLTPDVMVEKSKALLSDWTFDVISLAYPGLVKAGHPAAEPGNLGDGWVDYDYASAFGKPVRIINDAALQALAAYRGGRMLFVGLGTGAGGALVVDGLIAPLELGAMRLSRADTLFDCLAKRALEDFGEGQWREHLLEALKMLDAVFYPDDIVIGGGNADAAGDLPPRCRPFTNEDAYLGALRLWGHHEVTAIAQESSWRFEANWRQLQ